MAKRLPVLAAPCRSSAELEEALQKPRLAVEAVVGQDGCGARRAPQGRSARQPRYQLPVASAFHGPLTAVRSAAATATLQSAMLANMECLIALAQARSMHGCLALACLTTPARADDLDDFHRAVEAAMSHHRVAAGYLRTGNIDLAMLELEGTARSLGEGERRCPGPPRSATSSATPATMLDVAAAPDRHHAGAQSRPRRRRARIARRDPQVALGPAARERRHRAGRLRARCQYRDGRAVRARSKSRIGRAFPPAPSPIARPCSAATAWRRRGIRNHAEFRRLIDGALASLAQIPKAVETRDRDLLHRLLIELRSFDNLLAFRYG